MRFLPLVICTDERLYILIYGTQAGKFAEVRKDKTAICDQIVDEGKDEKRKIDGKLPRILQREALLVSERIVTD